MSHLVELQSLDFLLEIRSSLQAERMTGPASTFIRAKYYSSRLHRFFSEDPIGFMGGPNFYGYSENDPINRIDPFGLASLVFSISDGKLTVFPDHGRPFSIDASSGNDDCRNDPDCVRRSNVGPIPPGHYVLFSGQISGNIFYNIARLIIRLQDWGSFRVTLLPEFNTETFGRRGFFLHGGIRLGSAGCIDVGGGLFGNEATKRLLEVLRADPDGLVPVTVSP